MAMFDTPRSRSVTLSLPLAEQWTLHHVLLDRIEQESMADDPSRIDPPPVTVFQAFETLDAGETSFTIPQLEAMQALLAESQDSSAWWQRERGRLDPLRRRIADAIDQHQPAVPVD